MVHSHLARTKCCSSRRSPEAMFHDGNFDHSVSSQVFSVEWKMHHAYALSKKRWEPDGLDIDVGVEGVPLLKRIAQRA